MNPAPCVPIGGRDFRRCETWSNTVRYFWGLSLMLVWYGSRWRQ